MFPVLFEIGPVKIYMYGLMIAVGFLLVIFLIQREARRIGIDPRIISEMGFWSLFIGISGSRLAHIVMYPSGYSWSDPVGWINVTRGGLVFQGAIPAVILYCFVTLRRRQIRFWPMADIVMPYVPLGQAFGRLGCFFFGCCYGLRADLLPWGVRFPAGSPAYQEHLHRFPDFPAGAAHSFPVHPTQLYSILLLMIIFALLLVVKRFSSTIGVVLPLFLMLYGVKRFIVEFFRGDGNPSHLGLGVLTDQQVFSLGMLAIGVALLFYVRRRNFSADPAPATAAGARRA